MYVFEGGSALTTVAFYIGTALASANYSGFRGPSTLHSGIHTPPKFQGSPPSIILAILKGVGFQEENSDEI